MANSSSAEPSLASSRSANSSSRSSKAPFGAIGAEFVILVGVGTKELDDFDGEAFGGSGNADKSLALTLV